MRHNALHALKAFNDQPPLVQTKTVFDMIAEHQRQVEQLNGRPNWQPRAPPLPADTLVAYTPHLTLSCLPLLYLT